MALMFVTLHLLLILSCLSHIESRPSYIECQSNSECGPGHCCSIGPIRYSMPQCKPMLTKGLMCRPHSDSTINMTATYPDGAEVLLTDVHYILCPCADGLSCDRGVCMDKSEQHNYIDLVNENIKGKD